MERRGGRVTHHGRDPARWKVEEIIANLFDLAQYGKLLQATPFAREFEAVLYLTKPPRVAQNVLFAVLAPIARLLGYKGSYPEYLKREPSETIEAEPWAIP